MVSSVIVLLNVPIAWRIHILPDRRTKRLYKRTRKLQQIAGTQSISGGYQKR